MKITPRQIYIRMLRNRVESIDSAPLEQREHVLWAELIAAGYLNGTTKTDRTGVPNANIITGVTVKGRLFLQELEEIESKRTLAARMVRYGIPTLTYLGGIVSVVITEFIKKKLGL